MGKIWGIATQNAVFRGTEKTLSSKILKRVRGGGGKFWRRTCKQGGGTGKM